MDIHVMVKLATQAIFGLAAIVFTVYSIAAVYALNTYGRNRKLTSSMSIIYSAAAAGLLGWGFSIILTN